MAIPGFPDPDKVQTQTFLPNPSPPTTIPAIPEQSSDAACPLDLSEELFHGIKSACGSNAYPGQLHRTRCCPVLAAWLYSAYSRTALRRATARIPKTATFDMPVLPDDSETCVDSLEKAMGSRGIELVKPNETCDMVYCYCGIRVHPLSCPQSFTVNPDGKLVGDERVKKLEKNCLGNSPNGFSSLAGCSKCLKTLHSNSKALMCDMGVEMERLMQCRLNSGYFSKGFQSSICPVLVLALAFARTSNPGGRALNATSFPTWAFKWLS
nr:uncharacterized GPI-anchored protein At4g28100-like [Ipomoea batatas]GMD32526.1 uncharacterized GPI-anchored protein At4g28100-like [Ipomoea batatas]